MANQLELLSPEDGTERRWPEADPRLVKTHQIEPLCRWVQEAKELVVDFETTGLWTWEGARPFSCGLYSPDKGAKIVDFRFTPNAHEPFGKALLARQGINIGSNNSFECSMVRAAWGGELGGSLWDSKACYFAIDERRESFGKHGPLSQKSLVHHELKREPKFAMAVDHWFRSRGIPDNERRYDALPPELLVPYNLEDVIDAWDLYKHGRPKIEELGLLDLVLTDSALGRVLSDMRDRGLLLDVPYTEQLHKQVQERIKTAYKAFVAAVGRPLDLGSHQALFGLLYGEFNLPLHPDLEKSGRLDDVVLEWMLTLPEVQGDPKKKTTLEAIREWRECEKIDSTYLMPWLYEWQRDGVLHPNLNPFGAATRRFSSSNPNLQNVPARSELGQLVRRCFISRPGFRTFSFDHSQVEYRDFVHHCREPALVKGYREDPAFDIHQQVSDMLGVKRKDGKNLNFGLLFGMGKDKLARSLGRSKEDAAKLLGAYYARLPSIKQLKSRLDAEVRGKGYVRGVFGGRRHLAPADSYKALNSLTQMDARDLLAHGMVAAWPIIRENGGHALLQVHDELLFELPEDKCTPAVLSEIKHRMEDFKQFIIPLKVDAEEFKPNWGQTEAVHVQQEGR